MEPSLLCENVFVLNYPSDSKLKIENSPIIDLKPHLDILYSTQFSSLKLTDSIFEVFF